MRMSANVPLEIQLEIIKKVVCVKSLIRLRSVSKEWKSLIDSSEFISHHSVNQAHAHHLLLSCYEVKFVSIVDDDATFPNLNSKVSPIASPIIKQVGPILIDCSRGLVCLHLHDSDRILVWNPSIRKSVSIPLPSTTLEEYVLGFGVCPKTNEPKIVKLDLHESVNHRDYDNTAEVFTLSSRARARTRTWTRTRASARGWRSISINMSLKSLLFILDPVVVDGVIHWVAYVSNARVYRIISFDLTTEEFGQVHIPDAITNPRRVSLSKINESLALLHGYRIDSQPTKSLCDVWMMLKNGSFTKLFTVKVSEIRIIGFRKNSQPIIEHIRPDLVGELQVYEPSSEHFNSIGIYGSVFKMNSYTESLLLLNHPDSITEARDWPLPAPNSNSSKRKIID